MAEVDNQETLGYDMDQSWDISERRQEDELETNQRNTGTINTHTTGEKDQGGDRQSGKWAKPNDQGMGNKECEEERYAGQKTTRI